MKYDDASWHYGGDFPAELPPEAGATHAGMFLAWALLRGLGGQIHRDEPGTLEALRSRQTTPGRFLVERCDEKFTDEDLDDEGNEFARAYFDLDKGEYLSDYEKVLGKGLPSLYHVADSWKNFDVLKPVLDRRLEEWKRRR